MFLGKMPVLLALVGYPVALWSGSICVKANDYADMPLPTARVTVVNLRTMKATVGLTQRDGTTCLSQLPESLYSVEVGKEGFLNVRYYPVRLAHPATPTLQFRLPFGEITEGGLATEATLSGTLKHGDSVIEAAKICLLGDGDQPITCSATNDLGEYALSLPPGSYRVEIKMPDGSVHRSSIELQAPGIYRNRIAIR